MIATNNSKMMRTAEVLIANETSFEILPLLFEPLRALRSREKASSKMRQLEIKMFSAAVPQNDIMRRIRICRKNGVD
jgi:hypothetical protein